ncbi:MAG TPA: hypothetical protein VIK95_14955 [Egibacteraceae bacterium]
MHWRRTTAALCCLVLMVAACSRGEDDGQQATPRDDATTQATEVETAPSEPEASATDEPAAPTAAPPAPADEGAAEDGAAAAPEAADAPVDEQSFVPDATFGNDTVASDDFPASGGEVAQLTAVRLGTSDVGYDRIVLEFAGDDMPSYQVGLVDPPILADGSGEEVVIDGSSFLEIRVAPAQAGPAYRGPDRVQGDTSTVTELVRTGDVEGQLTWVAGLRQDMPFAVSALTDPLRLVVDVQLL